MSICRANQVLGLPLYHILRYVASTFKGLATTTTHCDLINFYQHRRGKLPGHVTTHDPIHDPYSDCRMINIQLLYRASDRKSPDFYLWQNQPELHRLKYASPLLRATSCFKRYNPIGLSGNVPINHRTQDLTRYLTRR
jgi:hypothetical protein